jgi:fido (protein-threonine AMPylation protein)
VFKHAGQIRKYDISKKEWVLKGDSVHYLNWEDLHRALDFDIQQERDFSYKGLTEEEKIKHITYFVSGLWQIHPFCEGNTRTTAVFTIQYLRSIGYTVDNDMFANHSWYFRNALVRANYKNSALEIDYDTSYLEKFFQNLLLGTKHDLKNRYLVIDAPTYFITDNEPQNKTNEPQNEPQKSIFDSLSKRQSQIVNIINANLRISKIEIARLLNVSESTIARDIKEINKFINLTWVGPSKTGHWQITQQ